MDVSVWVHTCVHTRVHIHTRIDASMEACTYVYTYTWTHICVYTSHVYTLVHLYVLTCPPWFVCMCVWIPTYLHIWTCVFLPVFIRVRLCIYACIYIYTRKHTRTVETPRHTRAHTDTCVYVSMPFERVCLFTCLHVYIDVSMCAYTYVHVYMHMCMHSLSLSLSPPFSLSLSLSLTFKLLEQFYDLTFLPGVFVSFPSWSTSKSYLFI